MEHNRIAEKFKYMYTITDLNHWEHNKIKHPAEIRLCSSIKQTIKKIEITPLDKGQVYTSSERVQLVQEIDKRK